jgi:hypothetical protein
MKRAGKILKISALLVIIISAALAFASLLLGDQVAAIVIGNINKNIDTRIYVGSFRLSFIREFPHASLELRDVIVLSSPGFNKDEFTGINTDTLLTASDLSVDFEITDIINKDYDIERIHLKKGKISLFTDSSGRVNYDIKKSQNNNDSSNLELNLNRILLSDLVILYKNNATLLEIDGMVTDGKLSSKISNDNITLTANAELNLKRISQDKITISVPFNAGLELTMENSDNRLSIKKGELSVEDIHFLVAGSIDSDNILDIELKGENIDLSKLRKYIPENYLRIPEHFDLSGILKFDSRITGKVSKIIRPHIELECNLNSGSIFNSETGMKISGVSFKTLYSNGSKNSQETALLSFQNLKARIGTADITGSLQILNLHNPETELYLSGRVNPGELKKMFNLDDITNSTGFFDVDLRLKTDLRPDDSISINKIVNLKPIASLRFNSFSIGFKKADLTFSNVNGVIDMAESVMARNLSMIYKGHKITVNGDFINLTEWIAGRNVTLNADADIHFNKLDPLIFSAGKGSESKKTETGRQTAFKMPGDLRLDIRLKTDSLNFESIAATEVVANFVYRSGLLTFNSFKMRSLDGIISGTGFIAQNIDKSLMSKGIFNISGININKTFITFRNFGQNFITSENLAGSLTGSLTLLLPMDSLLRVQTRSIVAEGHYIINNGELTDFEPVKELSSFIELSELENIRFEKLENDFFIRNNSLFMPQMEVNSSAADIAVNGRHNFDNTYEYHLKVRLSEILSKKRKKNQSGKSEFGVVEDDGLGRTSLLLRIESSGNGLKVGYDVKAAGDKVRRSIKSEKQTLKTILNQEYGLYKNDTIPEQKPAEKKTRFRITWDESDTINNEPAPPESKKENTLKSLFRKK